MTALASRAWEETYADLSRNRPGLLGAILGRAEAQVIRLGVDGQGHRADDARQGQEALGCARLMNNYAMRQGRKISEAIIAAAMRTQP
jgi:hypothetical protein